MKIGDDIRRFEILRLLCESLETWYNIFIRGTGDKIVHAFQGKMTFTPGDRVRLETGGAVIDGTFIDLDAFGGLVCEDGGRSITRPRSRPLSAAVKGE
jgi:biotin-(acetyl-CoA carboxylase) ligase